MNREDHIKIIKENAMTSGMVLKELGISRQTLSGLKAREILVPIIEGVYLKEDVMARKIKQTELREKYWKKKK